jgi:hypothetical protein
MQEAKEGKGLFAVSVRGMDGCGDEKRIRQY